MAFTEGGSFVVSSFLALLTFSAMQVYKTFLASTQMMTILGGFVGSILYVFLLTAVGNLEKAVFGQGYQTQLAEVVACIAISMVAAGSVHRVCATTCLMFSLLMTWTIHRMSQEMVPTGNVAQQKKKK